jgi:hypothetical protein
MSIDVSEERVTSIFRVQMAMNLLHAGFLLCSFWTLKMEAIRSSETSVHKPTARRYITEDGNIHNYRCENLKSYKDLFISCCIPLLRIFFLREDSSYI